MSWIWIIAAIIAIVVFSSFLYYMGYFYTPIPSVKELDELYILNVNFKGHYKHYSKAVYHFIDMIKKYNIDDVADAVCGSIYYDVCTPGCDMNALRWSIFVIISPSQYERYKEIDMPDMRLYTIPKSRIAITTFPMRNMLSYSLGPARAYPVLNQFIAENNFTEHACIELYHNKEPIKYIFYLDYSPVFSEAMEDLDYIDASKL